MNSSETDTMRAEYDFSGGIRGKHHEAYLEGTNVILLEPDLAERFHDSATVNHALRLLLQVAGDEVIKKLGSEVGAG
jgi:hypothetical protein